MTMRKELFILALVLFCACVASAAQAEEQELISIPALSAGFGPSLEAVNIGVAHPFRLAAYAMDAQGVKIPCGEMSTYTGKEFFIPRTVLSLSQAELKSAYSACLTQAHAVLRPAQATTTTATPKTPTPTRTTTATSTTTPTSTTATTNAATVLDLQQKLQAAGVRLSEVQKAAEKRFAEIRAEERAEAEKAKAEMKAEYERKLAAATQAAAGTPPHSRLSELEARVRDLEKENGELRLKLAARGGPPAPAWDLDGFLKTVRLKHYTRRVVVDPEVKKRAEEAQKRISEQQARGRTSPCALLVNTPQTDMPENFSLFGGLPGCGGKPCKGNADPGLEPASNSGVRSARLCPSPGLAGV